METLQYTKVRDVKSPNRAHPFDAGIDFYVPNDLTLDTMNEKFKTTGCQLSTVCNENGVIKQFIIQPNESILIPSGIKVKVPNGYMLQFTNKSGVASKRGLLVGANTVDVGYEGECHINLHNVSCKAQYIEAGDKIVQGILIPVNFAMPEEIESEDKLYEGSSSERGEDGFGSSGNK